MVGNSAACRLAHLRPELALLRAPGGPLGCRREAACGSLSRRGPRGVGTCAPAGVSGWPDDTNGPSKVVIGRGAPLAEDRWCGGQRGPLPAVPAPLGQRQRECALRDLRAARDPEVTAREAVPLDMCPGMGRGAPPGRRPRAPRSMRGACVETVPARPVSRRWQLPSNSDERRVDRRVKDRSLGWRHQRLRQHRHDLVHLRK